MNSFLDHTLLGSRYFFPKYDSFFNPHIVENQGLKLYCYYKKYTENAKTMVLFHGNAETAFDYIASPLLKLPYNFLIAEYRGFGLSDGIPSLVAMIDDVSVIINSLNIPYEEIVLFGRSIGSIYALHGASVFPNIAGLIIESGIADVSTRLKMRVNPKELGVTFELFEAECLKYFDYEKKIKSYCGKTLFLHTQHDSVVELSNAKILYDIANKPAKLHIFEDGGHNSILALNKDEYLGVVDDFMESV